MSDTTGSEGKNKGARSRLKYIQARLKELNAEKEALTGMIMGN